MDPVADPRRPADRDAGDEADDSADQIAAELQLYGRPRTVGEFGKIVGIDLDDRLWRRKERQWQPGVFRCGELPKREEETERCDPWTALAQARPHAAETISGDAA